MVLATARMRPPSRSYTTAGDLPADASFILNSKEHAEGGGRNELHYAQIEDTVAEVVRRARSALSLFCLRLLIGLLSRLRVRSLRGAIRCAR